MIQSGDLARGYCAFSVSLFLPGAGSVLDLVHVAKGGYAHGVPDPINSHKF